MSTRYIQTAVSDEDHKRFTVFACQHGMTLGELMETAVKTLIDSAENKGPLEDGKSKTS